MSSITFTIIQTDLFWEDKTANLRKLEEKIEGIGEKTEIILLPEMFSTGFSMNPATLAETMEGDTVQWMKKIATEKKAIITGSIIIKEARNNNGITTHTYYNRLVWMLPNGEYGIYDKRHRFGYAEEDLYYEAGNKRFIASAKGWKINLLVCYDLRFPVWARQQISNGQPEFDVLIYVANWPERRVHAWKTLLQARAIENQCYVIGVNRVGKDGNDINYTGESLVADPLGEILYIKKDEEDVHTFTLEKKTLESIREKLPFLKDADEFRIVND